MFQIQVTLPTEYQPAGTATLYPIEVKGIEIEGIEDIIAVRVNSVKSGGYTDSYVAYPDEVLGEVGSNLYRLPTMPVVGGGIFFHRPLALYILMDSSFWFGFINLG